MAQLPVVEGVERGTTKLANLAFLVASYPAGNQHIPPRHSWVDDVPFPRWDYLLWHYTFDGICRFAVPVARVHFRGCSFDLSHIMLQRHQKPVKSHKNILGKFVALLFSENFEVLKPTPLKFNMESEHLPLEMEDSFWKPSFSRSMLHFGGCKRGKKNGRPIPTLIPRGPGNLGVFVWIHCSIPYAPC